jgi:membrane fusion protein (multidrug efflux system)
MQCKGKIWPQLFLYFIFSILLFQNAYSVEAAQSPPDMPPAVVKVTVISSEEVNPPVEFVGRMKAIQAVDLRARVSGNLEQVKFKEGSEVQAGDLLYLIEQGLYKARVNANIAMVTQAKAALTKARQYRKRVESVKSGGVSKTDLETALASEQEAQANLDQAQANLIQSQLDLTYTTITAPISGRIGATNYTHGNLVGPDSGTLARIIQLDPIRVVFSVSENDLIEGRLQAKARKDKENSAEFQFVPKIRLSNGTMYPIAGKMEFAGNEVDTSTGTIAVYAVFDNPDQLLFPGQYVTVLVSMSNPKKKPVVPQSAVLEDKDGQYVFVVDKNNKVQQRRISTGPALETTWAVEDGLMAGETVIVSGIQKVRPGQTIKPIPADTP